MAHGALAGTTTALHHPMTFLTTITLHPTCRPHSQAPMARCPRTTAAMSRSQMVPLHQRLSQACGSHRLLQWNLERQPLGSPPTRQMHSLSSRQPMAPCTAWHGRSPQRSSRSSMLLRRRGRPCHRRGLSPYSVQSRPSHRQHRSDRVWTQRAGTSSTGAAAQWPCCTARQPRNPAGLCARPSTEGCAEHECFAVTLCWCP